MASIAAETAAIRAERAVYLDWFFSDPAVSCWASALFFNSCRLASSSALESLSYSLEISSCLTCAVKVMRIAISVKNPNMGFNVPPR